METTSLIKIEQLCTHCNIDMSFIQSLYELGHIDLIVERNDHFIEVSQLKSLESLIYFHTNLDINLEGVDAIAHLLKKVEMLQNDLIAANSKLKFYIEV